MSPPPAATAAARRPLARPPARHGLRLSRGALALPRPSLPRPSLRSASAPAGRLLHGRAAIAVLGAALLGLVFLQVSLLKLNTAISVNVQRSAQLERDNAQTRASISRLDAGRRVQDAAGQLGMVMPAAGAICFLDARRAGACSGGNAAEAGQGVDPVAELQSLTGSAAGAPGATTEGATQQSGDQTQPVSPVGTSPQPGAGETTPGGAPAAVTAPAATTAPQSPQTTQTPTATQPAGQAPASAQQQPAAPTEAAATGGLSATGG